MTIYYYSRFPKQAYGGIQVIYQHVDILNRRGISAAVVHEKPLFKRRQCRWFSHRTPVVYVRKLCQLRLSAEDVLVMPELYGPDMFDKAPRGNKVIFNQGAYSTFRGGYNLTKEDVKSPYSDPSLLGVMTVSEDSAQYCRTVFPTLNVFKTRNAIDTQLYQFERVKKKQIAFMTRRNARDILQVINILKLNGALADYQLMPIENCHQQAVADIMRQSLIFLCFGAAEGFQLPPAEAMASGCIVAGYHGYGAKEFMLPEHSYPIEPGRIIDYTKTVESIIKEYEKSPERLDRQREKASEFIQANYSATQQEHDVIDAWKQLKRPLHSSSGEVF